MKQKATPAHRFAEFGEAPFKFFHPTFHRGQVFGIGRGLHFPGQPRQDLRAGAGRGALDGMRAPGGRNTVAVSQALSQIRRLSRKILEKCGHYRGQ